MKRRIIKTGEKVDSYGRQADGSVNIPEYLAIWEPVVRARPEDLAETIQKCRGAHRAFLQREETIKANS